MTKSPKYQPLLASWPLLFASVHILSHISAPNISLHSFPDRTDGKEHHSRGNMTPTVARTLVPRKVMPESQPIDLK